MNMRLIGGIVSVVVLGAVLFFFAMRDASLRVSAPIVAGEVSDVKEDGTVYAVQHTFLCVLPDGTVARDWHFTDRWAKNQLSYETYEVAGRHVVAIRRDTSMPAKTVRFVRKLVSLNGPSLEGHDYLRIRINGVVTKIEVDKLFVEHNVDLKLQSTPYPPCGTPRS